MPRMDTSGARDHEQLLAAGKIHRKAREVLVNPILVDAGLWRCYTHL